jgi:hypothetical protein
MEKDLKRLRPVISGFHAFQQTIHAGIAGKYRHRQQAQ